MVLGIQLSQQQKNAECTAIREVLKEELGDSASDTGLCFIVCQKKIATKFLARQAPSPNWLALNEGMLVEELNHPDFIRTFYINGTAPPYSTPKPTRFYVASCDKSILDAEVPLPELTWLMCHYYPNWIGATKVPAPTMMAHKLAELAGTMNDSGINWKTEKFQDTLFFL